MKLIKEISEINSTKKELREFAFVVGGVFLVIGLIRAWHHKSFGFFIYPSSILILLGFVAPKLLMPLQKTWMALALCMGWVMTRVILSIVFFLVITPISLFLRLSGTRFFDLKFRDNTSSSYWQPRNEIKDKLSYEKQF